MASDAFTGDARISNNSWGPGTALGWGSYTARSAEYDQLVRDAQTGTGGNQQMVEVFAAGNDGDAIPGDENEGYGSIAAEGSAKNVITVGRLGGSAGERHGRLRRRPTRTRTVPRDIVDFSSRGPTDDGRLKPDLVAPGTHVTGAQPPAGTFRHRRLHRVVRDELLARVGHVAGGAAGRGGGSAGARAGSSRSWGRRRRPR